MVSRFKSGDRFSGKTSQYLQECIQNYLDACSDYDLNNEQKLRFFHNICDGEAKRFFRENIDRKTASFGDACAILRTEFHGASRQNRVRKLLQNLRLESIMQTKHCSIPGALEKI